MMVLLTPLITLAVVVALIASGVVVNMYFYSRGAIALSRRLRTLSVRDEAVMEGALPGRPRAADQDMGNYVRKGVTSFLIVILALLALLAIFLSNVVH